MTPLIPIGTRVRSRRSGAYGTVEERTITPHAEVLFWVRLDGYPSPFLMPAGNLEIIESEKEAAQ